MSAFPAGDTPPSDDDVRALAERVLGTAHAFLDIVERETPTLAATLRGERALAALTDLANLLEGMRAVLELIVDLDRALGHDPREHAAELEPIVAPLRAIVAAQETHDWPALAEALEGSFAAVVPRWRQLLASRAVPVLGTA